ncbi:MAG: hypothetical protein ABSE21_10390 [Bryobacteraceae bacterium]|jgi:hypothetical protein
MQEKGTEKGVNLGTWLGRREAFAQVAGRCSAADAACIRKMREERQYRELGMNWEQFCKRKLGISKRGADLIIAQLNEFGPAYFLLAQVAKVTPEEYRRISGSVRGQALLHAGEEIPIEAENAGRLAVAIDELRRGQKTVSDAGSRAGAEAGRGDAAEQAGTKPEDLDRVLDQLERTLTAAVSETGRVHGLRLDVPQIERLQSIVLAQLRRMPMVQLMRIVVRP